MSTYPEALQRDTAWLAALLRRLVGDAEVAADLQQDVVLAALQQPHRLHLGRAWFTAVARNLAAMWRRGRRREQDRIARLPACDAAPSPADLVAEAEMQQRAVAAVLALPAPYRDTVLLRFLHGMSVGATAAAMQVPEETVRTRQQRALTRLRAALQLPHRNRGAALLVGWWSCGLGMKTKHLIVAVGLFSLLVVGIVPRWRADCAASDAHAVVAAHSAAPTAPPPAMTAPPTEVLERTAASIVGPSAHAAEAQLTVRVRWSPDGAVAVGVPVLCNGIHGDSGSPPQYFATDARGEVCFAGLKAGRFRVMTQDWNSADVDVPAGEERHVDLQLTRGRRATGVVVDAAGRPVADAEILVSGAGTSPAWTFPVARSDAGGRFACAGLRKLGLLGARHARLGTSQFLMLTDHLGEGTPTNVVLHLPATSVDVRGRVVGEGGQPIADAWVAIDGPWRLADAPDGRRWASPPAWLGSTSVDGSFVAIGLPVGPNTLRIYRRGYAPHHARLELPAGTSSLESVVLHPGGTIVGTVRNAAGTAVAGADVSVSPGEYPRRSRTTTDRDGRFRLDDLPPGDHAFRVRATGFPDLQQRFAFEGAEQRSWDVVLQQGDSIRGRLVAEQGQPLVGWWLRCGSNATFTDDEGRFLFADSAPDGNLLIVRERFGSVPERLRIVDVMPSADEQTFVVPATTAPSAWLRGHCLDLDGVPVADALLDVEQDHNLIGLEDDRCGADGAFAVGPLPPGRYVLTARHARLVFAPLEVLLAPDEDLDLGALRAVNPTRLRLRLLGDRCVDYLTVELVGPGIRRTGQGIGVERSFDRMPPGHYRVVVSDGGRAEDCGTIELTPGAEMLHDLVLP
ncbi:MAG: sigma-70 family RNA polymerase sigma factor [Planctomycetes bacterium]|nr:sigma-70 family RNA polymerase sigma factor [Planctomycetota bacterium]